MSSLFFLTLVVRYISASSRWDVSFAPPKLPLLVVETLSLRSGLHFPPFRGWSDSNVVQYSWNAYGSLGVLRALLAATASVPSYFPVKSYQRIRSIS